MKQCWVLVFLHLGIRKVFVTESTCRPDATWMKDQAGKFVEHVKASGQQVKLLLRDRDGIYRPGFDKVIRQAGIRVKKNAVRSPNLQAHIERFIQSTQQEALDHFIVFGKQHFDHLVSQYVEHYHTERPHQAMGNVPLTGTWLENEQDPLDPEAIVCRTRLGGLLRHYERAAA